jgi:hypothetical protein
MRKRHPNHRLVKKHRNYTVDEVARLFGIHKNTVRSWVKSGLQTCDYKRPTLILGTQLAAFLTARRKARKRPCQPGELYCFRCRAPRTPAGMMADYQPINEKVGNLTALCPECESTMNQCISLSTLEVIRAKLDIAFPEAL